MRRFVAEHEPAFVICLSLFLAARGADVLARRPPRRKEVYQIDVLDQLPHLPLSTKRLGA